MIVFRALQGFLGGSMIPMVFTTAFVFFQGKQRVIAAATIGALASLAPTLGPTVGGWITDNWSWHWLFFINLVPGIFVAVAGADAGEASTTPDLVAAARRRLSGHRADRRCSSAAWNTRWRKARAGTGSATHDPHAPRGFPASAGVLFICAA